MEKIDQQKKTEKKKKKRNGTPQAYPQLRRLRTICTARLFSERARICDAPPSPKRVLSGSIATSRLAESGMSRLRTGPRSGANPTHHRLHLARRHSIFHDDDDEAPSEKASQCQLTGGGYNSPVRAGPARARRRAACLWATGATQKVKEVLRVPLGTSATRVKGKRRIGLSALTCPGPIGSVSHRSLM